MYPVNVIQKLNSQNAADLANARDGKFIIKPSGSVYLHAGPRTKVLDGERATTFIEAVRGKSSGAVREIVLSYFPEA